MPLQYTTLQFNKDYAATLHVDANNWGPPIITAIGNYASGEFWLYDPAEGLELVVKDGASGATRAQKNLLSGRRTVDGHVAETASTEIAPLSGYKEPTGDDVADRWSPLYRGPRTYKEQ